MPQQVKLREKGKKVDIVLAGVDRIDRDLALACTRMGRMVLVGRGLASAQSTEIHPEFAGSVRCVVTKRVQDGFENSKLGSILARLEIGRLQIAGLDDCSAL